MEVKEIEKKLKNHEERIKELEKYLPKKEIKKEKINYKGLSGGILFLINNGFFSVPRSLNQIIYELKKEGYYHSNAAVAKILSVNFVKNKKILTRLKDKKMWKYVIRK